jgi:hypothetical protein
MKKRHIPKKKLRADNSGDFLVVNMESKAVFQNWTHGPNLVAILGKNRLPTPAKRRIFVSELTICRAENRAPQL